MPEDRADVHRGALSRAETEAERLHVDINQRRKSAENVKAVRGGQQVEERTAGIGGHEDARLVQLAPGEGLADEEDHSQGGPGGPVAVEAIAASTLQGA